MSQTVVLLAAAGLCALALWWASTGLLLYLDRLPRRTFRVSMAAGTLLLGASIAALWWIRDWTEPAGAFVGFAAALGAWGWQELSFYTGYVTGPRKHACPADCSGPRHFYHAVQASLYHELAIIATAAVIALATAGAPNQTGLWAFVVLWIMHESARINVLLGVRNLHVDLLPDHLDYLACFCRTRALNWLMPFSLIGGAGATAWAGYRSFEAATAYGTASWGLITATLAIGVIEHLFLLLPIRVDRIWAWFTPSRDEQPADGGVSRPVEMTAAG